MSKKWINYHRTILVAIIILILGFVIWGGSHVVNANSKAEYTKNFVSIMIQEGDTLTSIAHSYAKSEADYKDYIDEVMYINNLNSDVIHSGCYLLVPVYEVKE